MASRWSPTFYRSAKKQPLNGYGKKLLLSVNYLLRSSGCVALNRAGSKSQREPSSTERQTFRLGSRQALATGPAGEASDWESCGPTLQPDKTMTESRSRNWPIPRMDSQPSVVWRYGGAVAISLSFIALRWLFAHYVIDDGVPFAMLFLPVALAAFYGGMGPGLVSVLVTISLADYFLIPPLYTIGLPNTNAVVATLLFSFSGLVVSALGELSRNAMMQSSSDADIRRIAQRELLANEERLRITEQVVAGGVWDWDIAHDTIYWSDGFQRLHDFPLDERPSRATWLASVYPEDRDRVVEDLDELFAHRLHNWATEYRIRTASGRTRWISSNGQAFYDRNGKPLRLVGIDLDITARRFAEEASREAAPRARLG